MELTFTGYTSKFFSSIHFVIWYSKVMSLAIQISYFLPQTPMRFTFVAPSLTEPTHKTLETYAQKKFRKLKKFLKKEDLMDHEFRISVKKVRGIFELTAELFDGHDIVVKCKDRDLRKAIDCGYDMMKKRLRRSNDKRISVRRLKGKFGSVLRKVKRPKFSI